MKNPPFELTGQIVSLVAEIAELVGRVSSTDRLSANPALRRSNRIKTVYGSLAIEQNTLLLSKWNPVFAWLPVESIVYDHQEAYYEAINTSNAAVSSTAFIEFMLAAIKASLIESANMSDEMSDVPKDKTAERWKRVQRFLEGHDVIQNADVRQLCGVSAATANRILAGFVAEGRLAKSRVGGHWRYQRMG